MATKKSSTRISTIRTGLREIVERVDTLPMLPALSRLLARMIEDPQASRQEITQIIVRDSVLAAQILRLVNSAYFNLPEKISDLSRAVHLAGFERIRNLVTSLSVASTLQKMTRRSQDDFVRFWKHSAAAAGICKRLALRKPEVDPEAAFNAGLLHDIGKLVLLEYAPREYHAIVTLAKQEGLSFHQAEWRLIQTDHAAVGGWLARKWNLPEPTIAAIEGHHDPDRCGGDFLTACVAFANYATQTKGLRCNGSFAEPVFDERVWKCLGLPQDDFYEMLGAVEREAEAAEAILEVAAREA